MLDSLPPWEKLLKKMVWSQLGDIRNKKILDFGSGIGVTASHFAEFNDVTAVEPDLESVKVRWQEHPYRQMTGGLDCLLDMEDGSFDVILCHNVLEYAEDRQEIIRQFYRLLKQEGMLSVVKHNRPGRVMQMVVLLNEFEKAKELLEGKDGTASRYGTIHYYEDEDIALWCGGFEIQKVSGIRTFWDLQQNQQCHRDPVWQEKMVEAENLVSELPVYRDIAFFHHLTLRKRKSSYTQE